MTTGSHDAPPAGRDIADSVGEGLAVVLLLSALAGAVDAYGLFILKDLFVSFMSGNTTSLGLALGHGDWPRVTLIASILGLFVLGAAGGEALALRLGRLQLPAIVLFVAVLLTVAAFWAKVEVYAMTFAMGALNAALDHAGKVNVSLTYITGTLVKLGRGLARWLSGATPNLDWLQQAISWLGIFGGALGASLVIVRYGHGSLVVLPILAFALSAALFGLGLMQIQPRAAAEGDHPKDGGGRAAASRSSGDMK